VLDPMPHLVPDPVPDPVPEPVPDSVPDPLPEPDPLVRGTDPGIRIRTKIIPNTELFGLSLIH
jgi:hypothetical protein